MNASDNLEPRHSGKAENAATSFPDSLSSQLDLADFLARHVHSYDPAKDDYDRPPFAADTKEGKNDPIYNAHSYHTKVPPRSIIPYILHYTQPGDLVLDAFCGSGMTGVAAQMCADPPINLLEQFPEIKDRVGSRACILNDLSPAACHIAYNYNTPVDIDALKREFERIKAAVQEEFEWLYGTEHYEPAVGLYDPANREVSSRLKNPPSKASSSTLLGDEERNWELLTKVQAEERLGYPVTELPRDDDWGKLDVATVKNWISIPAMIEFTVWSDTNRCEGLVTLTESSVNAKGKTVTRKKSVPRGCGKEIILWEAAVDKLTREVLSTFECPHCHQKWKKGDVPRLRSVPVMTRYEVEDIRGKASARERPISRREMDIIQETEARTIEHWHPQEPWDDRREMWRGGHRDAGITTTADFYTRRSLRALSLFWHLVSQVQDARIRKALQFLLTSISGRYAKTTRYLFGKAGNSAITGTLYVASFTVENALSRIVGNKWPDVLVALEAATKRSATCFVNRGSAGVLSGIADSSVDYIFTDPPFGSNLFYGDCSFLWESWLGEMTNLEDEAVWNKSVKPEEGGKTLGDYGNLMAAAFGEMFRVLKPGRWATVEFNNSDGKVFAAIKQAVTDAGFHIANMLLLDKAQKSFKQTKGATGEEDVVDKDVLFNLHKPAVAQAETNAADHDLEHQVADTVRQHLQTLPERIRAEPTKYSDEHRTTATINSMLMNVLIPRGVSVERLNLPFIERICARFFRKVGQHWYLRGEAVIGNGSNGFVTEEVTIKDEVTAIDWLRQKLSGTGVPPAKPGEAAPAAPRGMLVGELKPYWQKATGLLPAAVSQALVLDKLLAENFWRDLDSNRWREPTAEERKRMNDDASLRVLHDAERYLGASLARQTTDDERCRWIEVLYKACRDIEEKQAEALPALRGFDADEAYRVITRLFQSVLKDHVTADVFRRAEKQYRAAATKIAAQVEKEKEAEKPRKNDGDQTTMELWGEG